MGFAPIAIGACNGKILSTVNSPIYRGLIILLCNNKYAKLDGILVT